MSATTAQPRELQCQAQVSDEHAPYNGGHGRHQSPAQGGQTPGVGPTHAQLTALGQTGEWEQEQQGMHRLVCMREGYVEVVAQDRKSVV